MTGAFSESIPSMQKSHNPSRDTASPGLSSSRIPENVLEQRVRTIESLAQLLDSAFQIPGTKIRIGIDPLLGLIPGVGDFISLVVSSYPIYVAARCGVSWMTVLRMIFNVAMDSIVGLIPILGDIFDFTFKANQRNLRLLQQSLSHETSRTTRSKEQLMKVSGTIVLVLLGTVIFIAGAITAFLISLL